MMKIATTIFIYFSLVDTDLKDLEKPCKPHKFCNVSIMVMHVLLSILLYSSLHLSNKCNEAGGITCNQQI